MHQSSPTFPFCLPAIFPSKQWRQQCKLVIHIWEIPGKKRCLKFKGLCWEYTRNHLHKPGSILLLKQVTWQDGEQNNLNKKPQTPCPSPVLFFKAVHMLGAYKGERSPLSVRACVVVGSYGGVRETLTHSILRATSVVQLWKGMERTT